MSTQSEAMYIPLATNAHKERHRASAARIAPEHRRGGTVGHPYRMAIEILAVEHDDGVHTYPDGLTGKAKCLGFANKVRVAIEEAATEK